MNSKIEQFRKERKIKNFENIIDEEDDFGIYDEEYEDELDFNNYSSEDYFNSSFVDELIANKKSIDVSVDTDRITASQMGPNRALFSPSKVELLSKLLEKDENGDETSKKSLNDQNSQKDEGHSSYQPATSKLY